MFLIFNKQYRTEEKIINALIKNIKKSKIFVQYYDGELEKYELDTMDISFEVERNIIKVYAKDGEEIMSMNGTWDVRDEMQQARCAWFSEVLNAARRREQHEKNKLSKEKEIQEAKKALELSMKAKKAQQTEADKALAAFKRIKGVSK